MSNLYFITNEIGKYESSEIKNATAKALAQLQHTCRLPSPYQSELKKIVNALEQILDHAKKNTKKEERYHNYEPNYSIWDLD